MVSYVMEIKKLLIIASSLLIISSLSSFLCKVGGKTWDGVWKLYSFGFEIAYTNEDLFTWKRVVQVCGYLCRLSERLGSSYWLVIENSTRAPNATLAHTLLCLKLKMNSVFCFLLSCLCLQRKTFHKFNLLHIKKLNFVLLWNYSSVHNIIGDYAEYKQTN